MDWRQLWEICSAPDNVPIVGLIPLLAFYMEENGLGGIEVHKRSPAVDSMPALDSLPEEFREQFFGGLDYGIVGRKLLS